MTALRATGIGVRFGGVTALDGVDLQLRAGEITGLIGPNGAGKTTFIDAISGFVRCRGRLELDGRDLTRASPSIRARAGMRRTWQGGELFDDLSVSENLSVAARGGSLRELWPARRRSVDDGSEAIEWLGLSAVAGAYPAELSQGQRKLVGVARAVVGRPRVALLDEPAAGLDTTESRALGARLRTVAEGGPAVLLVDHDMGLVLSICDSVVVLDHGRVIAAGDAAAVRRDPAVIAAYIGSDASGLETVGAAGR